jgi:hypothetical protein
MLQESTTWDPRYIIREPSTSLKVYMLFLFVVCVFASVKLLRAWRPAPPFMLSRKAGSPDYLQLLDNSSASLKQWIGASFIGWGIFASASVYDVCNRLFDSKQIGSFVILFVIQDFSTSLMMELLVVLFLFLLRWHMLKRIERLRHMAG